MKIFAFCEDMSKSKHANRVSFIIYLDLNVLFFLCFFLIELCKTLENDGQEIKISTRMKNISFLCKMCSFNKKNENEFLTKSDFCYT